MSENPTWSFIMPKDITNDNSGKEYNIDDILAEFDLNHDNVTVSDDGEYEGDDDGDNTGDKADNSISTSDSNEYNESFNIDLKEQGKIKVESILNGVNEIELYDSAVVPEPINISEIKIPHIQLDIDEPKITEDTVDYADSNVEFPTDIPFLSETAESIDDIPQFFPEEIIDEPVTEELDETGILTVEDGVETIICGESEEEESNSDNIDDTTVDSGFSMDDTEDNDSGGKNSAVTETQEVSSISHKKGFLSGLFPVKGDGLAEIIRKIIFLASSIVFIAAGIMLISTLLQSRRAIADSEEIKKIVTTTIATSIDSSGNVVTVAPTAEEKKEHNHNIMDYYNKINEDIVAFIELEGCDIFQPVVKGDDNDYYLTRNYYGSANKAGSIFMDYRCTVSEDYISPNLVLYGHNQEDGTMFGNLKNYKQNTEFYAKNPVITLRTFYGIDEYLIYGFFVTNALKKQDSEGVVFNYHDFIEDINTESTFDWYINEIQKRNQIISPVDVQYGDKLLLLSTCSNEFSNSRFVVVARKLREGENISDYDFSEAKINYKAKGIDWKAIMSGETTTAAVNISESESIEETTTAPEEEVTEETSKKTKKIKALTKQETEVAVTTVPENASDSDVDSISVETTVTTTRFVKPTTVSKKVDATKTTTKITEAETTTIPEEASSETSDATETGGSR